ncbi:hypothetical protein GUJ93_ZPchr0013g37900 [Zizania palustris]|uniref:Uncharacterized protein n=1 Tax=Zizania palustris TaxID=103762 RepID=A0A8J6C5F1_ZIZPA|nr:hypothetical protein GUJ93_ZPchr0013g37900 [Zizania palustris]
MNADKHCLQRFDAETLVLEFVGKLQTYLQTFALQPWPQEACANLAEKTQLMISLSHLVPSPWKFDEAGLLGTNEEEVVAVHPSRQFFSTGRGFGLWERWLEDECSRKSPDGRGNENRAATLESYIWG